ncbi:MAG: hypothetical protein AAFX76_09745 [Planctomycetota bacterium]
MIFGESPGATAGGQVLKQVVLVGELPHQDRVVVAVAGDEVGGVLPGEGAGGAVGVVPGAVVFAVELGDELVTPEQGRHELHAVRGGRGHHGVHPSEVFRGVVAVEVPVVGAEPAGVEPGEGDVVVGQVGEAGVIARVVGVAKVAEKGVVVVDADPAVAFAVLGKDAVLDHQLLAACRHHGGQDKRHGQRQQHRRGPKVNGY